MGKAIFCDRCGKFKKIVETPSLIDRADGLDDRWKYLDGFGPSLNDPAGQRNAILLCGSCSEDFTRFMTVTLSVESPESK